MIRLAEINDLDTINEIYNIAVDSRVSTADLEHITKNERIKWFAEHNPSHYPVYVYIKNDKVVGWISVSPYRKSRKALEHVVEVSYYIHPAFQRMGIGSELLEFVMQKAQELNFSIIVCILLEINFSSIRLLEKFGFQKWAYLPDIVNLDGVICSHIYYGKKITE